MNLQSKWGWSFTYQAVLLLWGPVFLITAAHFGTSAAHHWLHDILRRLYYIPIILGAFYFGLRGALSASLIASLAYIPHAFMDVGQIDPADSTEKALEILLYNVVAIITGVLAAREKAERERQMAIAGELQVTLEEKKVFEEQLIRSGRLQALGELTAGLAHEIKNPLASIKGASEIVADEIAPDSPRQKMVEIQKRELDRLQTLLDRFLRFARPSIVEWKRLNLCSIIEHVRQLVAAQAQERGISLKSSGEQRSLQVMGDEEQLTQVILNLVLNAVDVSPAGSSVHLSCSMANHRGRRYGRVVVDDEGPGVPFKLRQEIFNPFYSTKDFGSGLGLSIAARIMDQHNGYLRVDDAPEGGARFETFVPFEQ
jgi:two-component system, NtrC family, sensor histidine kinase HydH